MEKEILVYNLIFIRKMKINHFSPIVHKKGNGVSDEELKK